MDYAFELVETEDEIVDVRGDIPAQQPAGFRLGAALPGMCGILKNL